MKENKETIMIPCKSGYGTETLKRMEPWEAERVLGIRLPMTGEMNTEFTFRKEQMETLGTRLYAAPFTPTDAAIVYQSRYKPMIRYCLPVTTFTQEELNKIQKKFIFLLLPKLGINRHAPRIMIYGPTSRGGRGIIDLLLEQPLQHLYTNLGHMRRNDNVGKLLRITLNDTQLETGLDKPFFEYPFEIGTYLAKNTRWRYIWYIVQKYQLKLQFHNMWSPTKIVTTVKKRLV